MDNAARILKIAGKRGKQAAGYQGLYLATIKSVQPFKMIIDNVDCEFLSDDVLINAQMLNFTYQGELTAGQTETGHISINGSANIDGYNRSISISNASATLNGNVTLSDTLTTLKNIFKAEDRVAVSAVGMNKFLILCKVVSWQ